ncbi:hypothetical protein NDU88_003309 [Pleurodeles waltl]|uniref:Uncharacterized protein n=1 Tax=Pleurodeles waltl TaxID=8319 RepID=A0AAV7QFB8_PLEWA|nr:hypothetical protein NDU88_003309 [Pleurodeles waltl]
MWLCPRVFLPPRRAQSYSGNKAGSGHHSPRCPCRKSPTQQSGALQCEHRGNEHWSALREKKNKNKRRQEAGVAYLEEVHRSTGNKDASACRLDSFCFNKAEVSPPLGGTEHKDLLRCPHNSLWKYRQHERGVRCCD